MQSNGGLVGARMRRGAGAHGAGPAGGVVGAATARGGLRILTPTGGTSTT
jgi:N-methylhydantoinase A/oxoprolinase/acetone carboxylase beta subunit